MIKYKIFDKKLALYLFSEDLYYCTTKSSLNFNNNHSSLYINFFFNLLINKY